MSEDHPANDANDDLEVQDQEVETLEDEDLVGEDLAGEEEFEEITSDEVDRVVGLLEELMQTVESENIKVHLEEALNNIFYLIYDEADDETEESDDVDLLSDAA